MVREMFKKERDNSVFDDYDSIPDVYGVYIPRHLHDEDSTKETEDRSMRLHDISSVPIVYGPYVPSGSSAAPNGVEKG